MQSIFTGVLFCIIALVEDQFMKVSCRFCGIIAPVLLDLWPCQLWLLEAPGQSIWRDWVWHELEIYGGNKCYFPLSIQLSVYVVFKEAAWFHQALIEMSLWRGILDCNVTFLWNADMRGPNSFDLEAKKKEKKLSVCVQRPVSSIQIESSYFLLGRAAYYFGSRCILVGQSGSR